MKMAVSWVNMPCSLVGFTMLGVIIQGSSKNSGCTQRFLRAVLPKRILKPLSKVKLLENVCKSNLIESNYSFSSRPGIFWLLHLSGEAVAQQRASFTDSSRANVHTNEFKGFSATSATNSYEQGPLVHCKQKQLLHALLLAPVFVFIMKVFTGVDTGTAPCPLG
jgi:hypothetical protein